MPTSQESQHEECPKSLVGVRADLDDRSPKRRNASVTGNRRLTLLAGLALVLGDPGCASKLPTWRGEGWVTDYDSAEREVRDSDRELLIVYQDAGYDADRSIEDALRDGPAAPLAKDYVCCSLVRSYEPDRRYAAQYGVTRAPGLIVVHRDGTYHASTGPLSPQEVVTFLENARPPGSRPAINPFIPRRADYRFLESLEEAQTVARQTGRDLLVVFHRTWSRDWDAIKKLLRRHEVYRRVANMVHCRVAVGGLSNPALISRFGTLALPALVIARPDGGFEVLQQPTSYEEIARFADRATRAETPSADPERNRSDEQAAPRSNP